MTDKKLRWQLQFFLKIASIVQGMDDLFNVCGTEMPTDVLKKFAAVNQAMRELIAAVKNS